MKTLGIAGIAFGLAIGYAAVANASQPILFNPSGGGSQGASSVALFDWAPGNAVQIGGNPANGLVPLPSATPSPIVFLMHGKLSNLFDVNQLIIPVPAGIEFTFVTGFMEVPVSTSSTGNSFVLAQGAPNYFEIWVGIPPNANMLAGTGFNDYVSNISPPQASHRILSGIVTSATGSFSPSSANCGAATGLFDQFQADDFSGQQTVCGQGSTNVSVDIITADVNYFPGITPDVIDTVKAFFNTSNVVPFRQTNPSRLFVEGDAGFDGTNPPAPSIMPKLGNVNGGFQTTASLDFQTQADANQTFEVGTPVGGGSCRVTYGGNDKNGNIDPNKFGQACSSDKGNKQNCYTFGGQVGAPTADPAQGGPFGEHTHHNVLGPAGDFVFRAGTHSAPSSTRITATACKDPGACRQAVAQASFKQIDFEGTGSFRTLDATATAYLSGKAGHPVLPDNQDTQIYYFRVDMDDNGEPGDKPSNKQSDIKACGNFLAADQNNPLSIPDPLLNDFASCQACADVYQIFICKDQNPCTESQAIYAVRGFLTGGNIQMHRIVK